MPQFKGKSYPLRRGMIIRFKMPKWKFKRGKYVACGHKFITGAITGESHEETGCHVFEIKDTKGKCHKLKGGHLYQTAEIVSLGIYSYWDNLKENFALSKAS